jgi:hypothetical protein
VLASSPADFGKFIADETEKWGKVIRAANINAALAPAAYASRTALPPLHARLASGRLA